MTRAGGEAAGGEASGDRGPRVICVLGSARSGTSLTMRMLNIAGLYVGPEEALRPASPGNPTGFWEHREMMWSSHRVLTALGGSWREPPRLAPGWEVSSELDGERERARRTIEETFRDRRLWGWKDASASLTLPFWQELIGQMRYVVCVRNPVDVASSGELLAGVPPEEIFDLWLAYVASALVNTAGRERIIVSYDDHFEDWRATAAHLARFAGCEPPAPGSEADREMERFIDVSLRHHRTTPAEALRDECLPTDVASLYLTVELLKATGPDPADPPDPRHEALVEAANTHAHHLLEAHGYR